MSQAWSRQHDSTLRVLLDTNCGVRRIAEKLGRAPDDVEARIRLLEHERRLANAHGSQQAAIIMAARDPATEADVAAWNRLGRGRAAA